MPGWRRSTSGEVCELWNGQKVVRTVGETPIAEFICLPLCAPVTLGRPASNRGLLLEALQTAGTPPMTNLGHQPNAGAGPLRLDNNLEISVTAATGINGGPSCSDSSDDFSNPVRDIAVDDGSEGDDGPMAQMMMLPVASAMALMTHLSFWIYQPWLTRIAWNGVGLDCSKLIHELDFSL